MCLGSGGECRINRCVHDQGECRTVMRRKSIRSASVCKIRRSVLDQKVCVGSGWECVGSGDEWVRPGLVSEISRDCKGPRKKECVGSGG